MKKENSKFDTSNDKEEINPTNDNLQQSKNDLIESKITLQKSTEINKEKQPSTEMPSLIK